MQVGDLQAVSVADLLRLEHCVQVLHGDDSFGNLGHGWMEEPGSSIRNAITVNIKQESNQQHVEKHNSRLP